MHYLEFYLVLLISGCRLLARHLLSLRYFFGMLDSCSPSRRRLLSRMHYLPLNHEVTFISVLRALLHFHVEHLCLGLFVHHTRLPGFPLAKAVNKTYDLTIIGYSPIRFVIADGWPQFWNGELTWQCRCR